MTFQDQTDINEVRRAHPSADVSADNSLFSMERSSVLCPASVSWPYNLLSVLVALALCLQLRVKHFDYPIVLPGHSASSQNPLLRSGRWSYCCFHILRCLMIQRCKDKNNSRHDAQIAKKNIRLCLSMSKQAVGPHPAFSFRGQAVDQEDDSWNAN